jgi:hypothetical protein
MPTIGGGQWNHRGKQQVEEYTREIEADKDSDDFVQSLQTTCIYPVKNNEKFRNREHLRTYNGIAI